MAARCLRRLDPQKTLFLLCDIQDKFRPVMPLFDSMVKNTNKLVQAGKAFELPLVVTEHYSEKLGKTVPEIDIKHACAVIQKIRFSMMVPEMTKKINEIFNGEPKDVVLFGIESHVCIEQTAMDFMNDNIGVVLAADCSCSRLNQDRDLAFDRLRQFGCVVRGHSLITESIIFNLMVDKNHPKFNDLRKLVSPLSADMELSKTVVSKSSSKPRPTAK